MDTRQKHRDRLAQQIRAYRRAYRTARRNNPTAFAHIPQGYADRETLCKIFGHGKSTVTKIANTHDLDAVITTARRQSFGIMHTAKIKAWSVNDFCRVYLLRNIER